MNLKHLQYFRILAKTQHYTKAAAQLYITQPSLSQAISELEKELNIKLFEKVGRNIKLTKYGQYFLTYVENGLEELEKGERNLQKLTNANTGIIDLAFIFSLGADFVPSIIQRFMEENEGAQVTFSCYQGTTQSIVQGLKEENYDLAFCTFAEHEPDIEFIPLMKRDIVLITHKDHPLASKEIVEFKDTADEKFVCFNRKSLFRPVIDQLFLDAGITPNISCEVGEDTALVGLVAAKQGVGILPRSSTLDLFDIKVLPFEKPLKEQTIYMASVKGRYLSPVVERFKSFIANNRLDQKGSD